jgi:hypothetical protein
MSDRSNRPLSTQEKLAFERIKGLIKFVYNGPAPNAFFCANFGMLYGLYGAPVSNRFKLHSNRFKVHLAGNHRYFGPHYSQVSRLGNGQNGLMSIDNCCEVISSRNPNYKSVPLR